MDFFLVELEVNGFVIHYTFPAFLDFLPGTKPGCYGEQEGCYVHGMNKKISCLRLSHTLPGDEGPKFKSLLYQTPVCRQQPLDCYPVCPFHMAAVPVCLNIQMDYTSICQDCSRPGPWDNLRKVWLFLFPPWNFPPYHPLVGWGSALEHAMRMQPWGCTNPPSSGAGSDPDTSSI